MKTFILPNFYASFDGLIVKVSTIYDEESLIMLCIDDRDGLQNYSQIANDGYVSVLDGSVLYDTGVIGLNINGDIAALQNLEQADYIKAVMWDMPYKKNDDIQRGTAWMKGLNEFMKTINTNG